MSSSESATNRAENDDALVSAVQKLTEEVRVLREVVDEFREEAQWLIRNHTECAKALHEISDDVQVLVRQAFQRPMEEPKARTDMAAAFAAVPQNQDVHVVEPTPEPLTQPIAGDTADAAEDVDASLPLTSDSASTVDMQSPGERLHDLTVNDEARSESAPKRQSQPLHIRLYFQRHMTDVVRAIGYQLLSREDALARLKPLVDQYGKPKIEAAAEELLHLEQNGDLVTACLRDNVRTLARQILGRPPEGNESTKLPAAAPKSASIAIPLTDSSKLKPVKMSREKALSEFREHLESRGLTFEQIDDEARRDYTEKHLSALDFIVRENGEPPELITIRKTVSKTQLHDLAEWKSLVGNGVTVSRIWRYCDDAGRESWETVALDLEHARDIS